jgi:hypothetical protein
MGARPDSLKVPISLSAPLARIEPALPSDYSTVYGPIHH